MFEFIELLWAAESAFQATKFACFVTAWWKRVEIGISVCISKHYDTGSNRDIKIYVLREVNVQEIFKVNRPRRSRFLGGLSPISIRLLLLRNCMDETTSSHEFCIRPYLHFNVRAHAISSRRFRQCCVELLDICRRCRSDPQVGI